MVDQKLGIHAEHVIQDFFIRNTASRHITHSDHSCRFQSLRISISYAPEVGKWPMRPQLPPVAHFIQFGNPHTVPIRGSLLRHDVHRNLGKVKVRPDPGSCRNPGLLQYLPHHLHRQLVRCHAIGLQVRSRIDKHLINGVDMNVFRRDIAQIDLVNFCTVFHVQGHAGRGRNERQFQRRIGIQLIDIIRLPGKLPCLSLPLAVHFLYFLNNLKQSCPP